jgi:hypothetical protein
LKLEKRLYQGILNEAVGLGRLTGGIADFAELESLVVDYGLDINEAAMSNVDLPSNQESMSVALESGNLVLVQLMARLLDVKDFKAWRNRDGRNMLHVAAGHTSSWQALVRREGLRSIEEQEQYGHADPLNGKLHFIDHIWNHENASFLNEARKYVQDERMGSLCRFRDILSHYETQCQETEDTRRKLQLVQWLIQQGVTLPE